MSFKFTLELIYKPYLFYMDWLGPKAIFKPLHGRKFRIWKAVTPVSAVSEEKPWETLDENSPYFCRDRGLNPGPPDSQ